MSKRWQIGGLEILEVRLMDSIQVHNLSLHVGDTGIMDDDGMRLEIHIYM